MTHLESVTAGHLEIKHFRFTVLAYWICHKFMIKTAKNGLFFCVDGNQQI